MKILKKKAVLIGVIGDRENCSVGYYKYECPTCNGTVNENYICCPYCGQRIYFDSTGIDLIDQFSNELKIKK